MANEWIIVERRQTLSAEFFFLLLVVSDQCKCEVVFARFCHYDDLTDPICRLISSNQDVFSCENVQLVIKSISICLRNRLFR